MRNPDEIIVNGRKLSDVLDIHKLWLEDRSGKWADLRHADLQQADLREANLREADLRGADLRGADLRWADLRGADLRWADLREADLRGADLRWADVDFSCWPLWCGSKGVKVDRRIAAQLAAHFCALDCDDFDYQAARAAIWEFAKTSPRAADLGLKGGEE